MKDHVLELQTSLEAANVLIALNRIRGMPEWAAVDRALADFVVRRTKWAMDPNVPLEDVSRARHEVWMASWLKQRVEVKPEDMARCVESITTLRNKLQMLQTSGEAIPSDVLDEANQVLNQFPQARQPWNRSKNFES